MLLFVLDKIFAKSLRWKPICQANSSCCTQTLWPCGSRSYNCQKNFARFAFLPNAVFDQSSVRHNCAISVFEGIMKGLSSSISTPILINKVKRHFALVVSSSLFFRLGKDIL